MSIFFMNKEPSLCNGNSVHHQNW